MALFSRSSGDLPGTVAPLRDLARSPKDLKKLSAGDIVVIDGPQISLGLAQRLIETNVAAVATAIPAEKGNVPRFGPQLLIDSGITFVDGLDGRDALKSGKKYRLHEGTLYKGQDAVASGRVIDLDEAVATFNESREMLVDHMEALAGNLTEFVRSEAPLFIDGLGIPEVDVPINGRPVLVVSPGPGHEEEIRELKGFIKANDPVIIGVESAANSLLEAGHKPVLVVGDPDTMSDKTLRCGAIVILPADPDGHAAGLARIQDLGVGAMTFPAATTSATDLALLLASYHGAALIVNSGAPFDLTTLFDEQQRALVPSALLTRELVGSRLVDAPAMTRIDEMGTTSSGWWWALLALIILLLVIVGIAGLYGDGGNFVSNLHSTWDSLLDQLHVRW